MKRVKSRHMHMWIRKHPAAGRVFAFVMLLGLPIIMAITILWEGRRDFADGFAKFFAAAFLPWDDE